MLSQTNVLKARPFESSSWLFMHSEHNLVLFYEITNVNIFPNGIHVHYLLLCGTLVILNVVIMTTNKPSDYFSQIQGFDDPVVHTSSGRKCFIKRFFIELN